MENTGYRKYLVLLVGVGLVLALQSGNAAFRCGPNLVDIGLRTFEVEERCGEPDYAVTYPLRTLAGLGVTDEAEHWYYNPGPHGLIHMLVFHNGILRREQTLGRGFNDGTDARCKPGDLRTGLSEFEVMAMCGEPIASRLFWRSYATHGKGHFGFGNYVMPVKEWVYEFGPNQFRRAVLMEGGRVSSIETLDKPR